MKSPGELTVLFRERGLKITAQRQRIFEALAGNGAHPSAESIYAMVRRELSSISLKTVYLTLNDLAAMGEIQQFEFGTGASRFDPNNEAHHHLVCTACGKVRDFHAELADVTVPEDQSQGFVVTASEVVFRGLCGDCQREVAAIS